MKRKKVKGNVFFYIKLLGVFFAVVLIALMIYPLEKEQYDPDLHDCLEWKKGSWICIFNSTITSCDEGVACTECVYDETIVSNECLKFKPKPYCSTPKGLTIGVSEGDCVCDEYEYWNETIDKREEVYLKRKGRRENRIESFYECYESNFPNARNPYAEVVSELCGTLDFHEDKIRKGTEDWNSKTGVYADEYAYKNFLVYVREYMKCIKAHEPNECEKGNEGWILDYDERCYFVGVHKCGEEHIVCRKKVINDLSCEELLDYYTNGNCASGGVICFKTKYPFANKELILFFMSQKGCFK